MLIFLTLIVALLSMNLSITEKYFKSKIKFSGAVRAGKSLCQYSWLVAVWTVSNRHNNIMITYNSKKKNKELQR